MEATSILLFFQVLFYYNSSLTSCFNNSRFTKLTNSRRSTQPVHFKPFSLNTFFSWRRRMVSGSIVDKSISNKPRYLIVACSWFVSIPYLFFWCLHLLQCDRFLFILNNILSDKKKKDLNRKNKTKQTIISFCKTFAQHFWWYRIHHWFTHLSNSFFFFFFQIFKRFFFFFFKF